MLSLTLRLLGTAYRGVRGVAIGAVEPRLHHPAPAQFTTAASQRHYGMDWLRVGAFALLILDHIGMVFAPWPGW